MCAREVPGSSPPRHLESGVDPGNEVRKSRNFSGPIRAISYEQRDFKKSNFTIILLFVIFKTCQKKSLSKQANDSFVLGLSGKKSSRKVRETGPCTERYFSGYTGFPLPSKTNICLDLRPISAPALELLYT